MALPTRPPVRHLNGRRGLPSIGVGLSPPAWRRQHPHEPGNFLHGSQSQRRDFCRRRVSEVFRPGPAWPPRGIMPAAMFAIAFPGRAARSRRCYSTWPRAGRRPRINSRMSVRYAQPSGPRSEAMNKAADACNKLTNALDKAFDILMKFRLVYFP
jgi:hypothetical protein